VAIILLFDYLSCAFHVTQENPAFSNLALTFQNLEYFHRINFAWSEMANPPCGFLSQSHLSLVMTALKYLWLFHLASFWILWLVSHLDQIDQLEYRWSHPGNAD
jgi:hypothetical protein